MMARVSRLRPRTATGTVWAICGGGRRRLGVCWRFGVLRGRGLLCILDCRCLWQSDWSDRSDLSDLFLGRNIAPLGDANTPLLPHSGYRELRSYQVAEAVYEV